MLEPIQNDPAKAFVLIALLYMLIVGLWDNDNASRP